MKQFNGRVVALTGAGSGIGRALALALAGRGAELAVADVNETGLEETAAQLKGLGANVSVHRVDVADADAVKAYAAAVVAEHGRVHAVFNNAGVALIQSVSQQNLADFEWLMAINFWGVVYGSRAFLPYLQEVEEAHIVNTSSILGVIAMPTQSAYCAAKYAVRGFSEALRMELADSHIGVSHVCPGGVKTGIVRASRYTPTDNEAPTREETAQRFAQRAALQPEEAAEIILRGVARNRSRILVGRDAHVLALLQRLSPNRYPQLISWLWGREERKRGPLPGAGSR